MKTEIEIVKEWTKDKYDTFSNKYCVRRKLLGFLPFYDAEFVENYLRTNKQDKFFFLTCTIGIFNIIFMTISLCTDNFSDLIGYGIILGGLYLLNNYNFRIFYRESEAKKRVQEILSDKMKGKLINTSVVEKYILDKDELIVEKIKQENK